MCCGICKLAISVYGAFAYLVALLGVLILMMYVSGTGFLPIDINSKIADSTTVVAVVVNLSVMFLFGAHHSLAARSGFKMWLAKFIPAAIERSSYILVSGLFMVGICYFWQPLAGQVWQFENWMVLAALKTISVLGLLVIVVASFEIDHLQLMGLRQSFGKERKNDGILRERFLYKIVRHPIQTGVLMCIWSTGQMSMTQCMLSFCLSVYILIGLSFEERSLVAHFGEQYLDYKKRVPRLIPFLFYRK